MNNTEVFDDSVQADTVSRALLRLTELCIEAEFATKRRDTACEALDIIRQTFEVAHDLRTLLMSLGDGLLRIGRPVDGILETLQYNLDIMQDASKWLQRDHGFAHIAELIELGNADQGAQELFEVARHLHPEIVRDEATVAGVQAIREIFGPLNELLIALDVVECIALGKKSDDVPF